MQDKAGEDEAEEEEEDVCREYFHVSHDILI